MTKKEYNGWFNYETWLAALWIDNDEGTYEERRRIVKEVVDDNEDSPDEWPALAETALQEWFEGMIPDGIGSSGIWADFINAALSEINWREIAENWLDETDKPEPDEDTD